MEKKILLVGIEKEKRKQIMQFCKSQNIKASNIGPSKYLENIGFLVERPGILSSGKTNMSDEMLPEMMVISGLSDHELDDFLAGYKENGIEPVIRKAMVTDVNAKWNLLKLYEQLYEEVSFQN